MPDGSTTRGKLKAGASLAVEALREWVRDRCDGLAAAMAFGALLATAPFLAGIVIVAVRSFGEEWARTHVVPAVLAWAGPRGAAALRFLLIQTERIEPQTLVSLGVVSVTGLLLGASDFFLRMQDALETTWDVRREEARIRVQLRKRLLGLLYAVVSGVIVFIGFAAAGWTMSLGDSEPARSLPGGIRLAGEVLVAFLTFWTLVTFWLKLMPPVHLTLRQVLPWAALIAALHLLGRLVLTWRAARQADANIIAAESVVLVLLWFYYASMVFLYGAELMRLYLQRTARFGVVNTNEGSQRR